LPNGKSEILNHGFAKHIACFRNVMHVATNLDKIFCLLMAEPDAKPLRTTQLIFADFDYIIPTLAPKFV